MYSKSAEIFLIEALFEQDDMVILPNPIADSRKSLFVVSNESDLCESLAGQANTTPPLPSVYVLWNTVI